MIRLGLQQLIMGLIMTKCEGKVATLEELLKESPLEGNIGIGHTR